MTPFVIGTRDDVAGFALAGVPGALCTTREEVEAALAGLGDDVLLIVSAAIAPLAPAPVRAMAVVLPER